MKTTLLTVILVLAICGISSAQSSETITVRAGQQKSTPLSKLTIKFVSVLNDSRCPANAKCVTAGNAKIQVKISGQQSGSRLFEFNSTLGPKGDQFEGYAISLVRLSPERAIDNRRIPIRYTAEFSIVRLQR